ncbi:P-loop containing nucleoside triphosphate hydrolase protein, partial [Colletotrichum phormii]
RGGLTQFLTQIDGLSASQKAPFVLVATNRPWDLDEAFHRRLPHKILFKLPDEECRRRIPSRTCESDDLDDDVDVTKLAKQTAGYSGSDLRSVCAQAALMWSLENVKLEHPERKLRLKRKHFARVTGKIRPSNAPQASCQMQEFVDRFNP